MAKVIAVTGKGGTGKTTVSGLILRFLKQHASGPILALDADPDANLASTLGVTVETTLGDLREETLKAMKNFPAGMSKSAYIEAGLHETIVEMEKIDLMTMGRSEGPGCYCYINSLLRKFADDVHGSYEWVVMDNEAGLEHLSRRTASRVDALIAVINESPFSIDCAARIDRLVTDLKNEVKHKYLLINGVPEDRVERVRERAGPIEMEVLGWLPRDPGLEDCIFQGKSLLDLDGGPAVSSMDAIMKKVGDGQWT